MKKRATRCSGVNDYQGPHLHIPLDFVDWGEFAGKRWFACDMERLSAVWEPLECRIEGIEEDPDDYLIEVQLFGYEEEFEIPQDGVITVHVPWGYPGLTEQGSDYRRITCGVTARNKATGWGTPLDSITVSAYLTKDDLPADPPWLASVPEIVRAATETDHRHRGHVLPWHECEPRPSSRTRRSPLPAGAPRLGAFENGGYFFGITVDRDGTPYKNYVASRRYEMFGPLVDRSVPGNEPDYPLRQCLHRTDSRANTERLRDHSRVAETVLGLDAGGFHDWAIPAVDVAELLYRNMHTGYRPWPLQPADGDNASSLPESLPPYRLVDGTNTYSDYPQTSSVEPFRRFGTEAFNKYTTCHISTVAMANVPLDTWVEQSFIEFGGTPRRSAQPGINSFGIRPVRREKFNR